MICAFNKAQLGAVMEKALTELVLELQKTQDEEITVSSSAGGFPYKLVIKASGNTANLIWDHVNGCFVIVGDPLPVTKDAGKVKAWERPEPVQAPDPESEPEIRITVDNVVAQFMGLPKEKRPAFFSEVWRLINSEV